ncbi:MAG TPA: UMP kinase [Candidatus Paceibacterota bacterium]|nr:UMP kinase [Candidatus Paceibacterota bacterium]HPC12500.1 UMP kinase [Candidatus Paceibacterota bacterium]HPI66549.1 UMP kinase [Candidatus Paceibacterota bacterium]HQC46041.1 UMP kinase [Candidatus Paceibacterota bacterium]
MENKKIVMSLGGSLIVPDDIDSPFVKSFVSFIKEYVDKGYEFVLITGGGKISRDYNNALKEITNPTNEDLDWLGIAITRVNAEFIRVALGNLAFSKIITDPDFIPETTKPVIVGGGWKPGNSSDLAAIHSAKSLGAKTVINLSNIDYVYDKDPKKDETAKPIEKIKWLDFMLLFPNEWIPGRNIPFDPIASCEAQNSGLEVVILNGKDLNNLRNYLDNKPFKGTIIN